MEDSKTISTEWHELKQAAETLGVKESVILSAIEATGSNNRKKVYDYIAEQKELKEEPIGWESINISRHIQIADTYTGDCSSEKKIQKLGEEVVELAIAIALNDQDNIEEELGDCLFILVHLKNRLTDYSWEELLTMASTKMVRRNTV